MRAEQQTNPAPDHDKHCDLCGIETTRLVEDRANKWMCCTNCRPKHLKLVVDNGKR